MTGWPIIFSAEMVRAILDGRKTQTRRIIKPSNSLFDGGAWPKEAKAPGALDMAHAWIDPGLGDGEYLKAPWLERETVHRLYPKIEPGDRLWVKEALAYWEGPVSDCIGYRADYTDFGRWEAALMVWQRFAGFTRITSPQFMPRDLSRITLAVTAVRAQRVQSISESDAMAEGVQPVPAPPDDGSAPHVEGFADFWGSIYGPGAWEHNDWVWVYDFERVE